MRGFAAPVPQRSSNNDPLSRRAARRGACLPALLASLAVPCALIVTPPAVASARPAVASARPPAAAAHPAVASARPVGASARPAAVTQCATAGLVIWLNAEDSGALGSFYFKIEFANLSGRTCTLAGYPGVSAVDLHGGQIGSPARREVTGAPGVVTLAPEAQATALLHVVDVGVLPASACHQTAAAGLRVYPPGERASKLVPFPFRTCAKLGDSPMSVRSVKLE